MNRTWNIKFSNNNNLYQQYIKFSHYLHNCASSQQIELWIFATLFAIEWANHRLATKMRNQAKCRLHNESNALCERTFSKMFVYLQINPIDIGADLRHFCAELQYRIWYTYIYIYIYIFVEI